LAFTTSKNGLPVSEGAVFPKSHSTLDTIANSHDLIFGTCDSSLQWSLTNIRHRFASSIPYSNFLFENISD
jgi:retron-type reverse transcriptase